MLTRMTEAFVHIRVAVDASESWRAVTFVGSQFILADAVTTYLWLQHALVYIVGTIATCPAARALALIIPIGQIKAGATILARLSGTLIAHFVLWTHALSVLGTHHWLLAVACRAFLGLLTAISRIAQGAIAVCAIHRASTSI